MQARHHLALPVAGEAAPQPEVEELERMRARRLGGAGAQPPDLACQPEAALGQRGGAIEAPEVQLAHDGEHEDLERHHVHLRPGGDDGERPALGAHLDELALEAEDAQEVDEVGLDEAQPAQVGQLVGGEGESTEPIELAVHLLAQLGQRPGAAVAADEAVLGVRLRMAMQHRLPHRDHVEVGVEQARDDRRAAVRCSRCGGRHSAAAMRSRSAVSGSAPTPACTLSRMCAARPVPGMTQLTAG